MRPKKHELDGNEQDHPIDEDVVSQIACANGVSPRTLDVALWRFSRSLNTNPEAIADLVNDYGSVETRVEYINDDVMVIEAPLVIVAQWLRWTGLRLGETRREQGERSTPAMVREAHAMQAARLSSSSGENTVAFVLSQSADSDCE